MPLILSGGLNADNVGEAIRVVAPYAVDVASGTESAPGIKDPVKIAAFAEAVRRGAGVDEGPEEAVVSAPAGSTEPAQ